MVRSHFAGDVTDQGVRNNHSFPKGWCEESSKCFHWEMKNIENDTFIEGEWVNAMQI